MPSTFPSFGIPQVPFTFETLEIIFPYAIAISLVGLLESFLTANVVDDLTDPPSNKNKEAYPQGIANFFSGLFGLIDLYNLSKLQLLQNAILNWQY